MKYIEVKQACRTGRELTNRVEFEFHKTVVYVPLSNKWKVKVALIARRTLYYLIDPKGNQFGGDDAMNTFVPWAMKFMNT